jgi:3-deoxy-D-manno-octulosonic-acid transferase
VIFYNLLTLILTPFFSLFLLRNKRGRTRILERFGIWPSFKQNYNKPLWIQAASLGEVRAIESLLLKLAAEKIDFFVVCTSYSGVEYVEKLGFEARLLPFDNSLFLKKVLAKSKASKIILVETELWPALINCGFSIGIKFILINGRLTNTSLKRYRFLSGFLLSLLADFQSFLVVDDKERDNFISLGVDHTKIKIVGNMKFDRQAKYFKKEELDKSLFIKNGEPVFICASLRPNEEEIIFAALKEFFSKTNNLALKVVIAPRHAEYFSYFAEKLSQSALTFIRASSFDERKVTNILLLDKLGELERFYAVADLTFVGGTLRNGYGGHNPLEAALYGSAIILGEHGQVIAKLREEMKRAGVIEIISSKEELLKILSLLVSNRLLVNQQGEKARQFYLSLAGATQRVFDEIND